MKRTCVSVVDIPVLHLLVFIDIGSKNSEQLNAINTEQTQQIYTYDNITRVGEKELASCQRRGHGAC